MCDDTPLIDFVMLVVTDALKPEMPVQARERVGVSRGVFD